MTQISRPFQIALVAFALCVAVWFVALRGHGPSSTGGSGSNPSGASAPAAPSAAAQAKSAAAPTPIYHGAAPGVEGLSRAINKAHGAVAQSQSNAKHLENAEPGGSIPSAATGSKQAATSRAVVPQTAAPAKAVVTVTKSTAHAPRTVTQHNGIPAMQAAVEGELKQGKVVLLLFWNPKGADDVAVHTELEVLLAAHREIQRVGHAKQVQKLLKTIGLELNKKIAVHYASASKVASFGSFTRAVQVYQTPTILIINRHGVTTTLTGLTDAFSIEQTIDEAA